jgi:putative DNA primase/helicase
VESISDARFLQSTAKKGIGANMTFDELVKAVRGTRNGRWIRIAGPGHRKRDDSLGFMLDPAARDGFRVHSFAEDDPAECRAYVKQLLATVSKGGLLTLEGGQEPGSDSDQAARLARALALWNEALPPEETPVETYLSARRCELPPSAGWVLRFHPQCPFGSHRFPAMIALVRDVVTNAPRGIQRTAVKDDGSGKRQMPAGMKPRMLMGSAKGAAVMLLPAAGRMGIGEGIETSLSAKQIFDIPAWAALSAGGIAAFPVIPCINRLTIFADYDVAGVQAAGKCKWRHKTAGIEVEVRCPPNFDTDWNNYLLEESNNAYHIKKNQAV